MQEGSCRHASVQVAVLVVLRPFRGHLQDQPVVAEGSRGSREAGADGREGRNASSRMPSGGPGPRCRPSHGPCSAPDRTTRGGRQSAGEYFAASQLEDIRSEDEAFLQLLPLSRKNSFRTLKMTGFVGSTSPMFSASCPRSPAAAHEAHTGMTRAMAMQIRIPMLPVAYPSDHRVYRSPCR